MMTEWMNKWLMALQGQIVKTSQMFHYIGFCDSMICTNDLSPRINPLNCWISHSLA